jgi:hypothetical protein
VSEGLEPFVVAMLDLDRSSDSREQTKGTLLFLANLLASGSLPPSGRAYLADVIRAVAEEDFDAILPKVKKKPATPSVTIYAEVERERPNHARVKDAHAAVGRRHGLEGPTVAKIASRGRTGFKGALRNFIEAGHPVERNQVVKMAAEKLRINTDVIEALLTD